MAGQRRTSASDSQKKKTLKKAATFYRRLFQIISYLPVIMIVIGAILLAHPHILQEEEYHLHLFHWFPRIIASIFSAGLLCFSWNWSIPRKPSRILKASFWIVSLFCYGGGVLYILVKSNRNPAARVMVIFSLIAHALCYWWVIPWLEYAAGVIKITTATWLPNQSFALFFWTILSAALHSSVLISGIEGASLARVSPDPDTKFLLCVLCSMAHTMLVIGNAFLGTIGILGRRKKMLQDLIGGYNFSLEASLV